MCLTYMGRRKIFWGWLTRLMNSDVKQTLTAGYTSLLMYQAYKTYSPERGKRRMDWKQEPKQKFQTSLKPVSNKLSCQVSCGILHCMLFFIVWFMYRGSHWASTASSTSASDPVCQQTCISCWWSWGWEGQSNTVVLHPAPWWYRPGGWSGMCRLSSIQLDCESARLNVSGQIDFQVKII